MLSLFAFYCCVKTLARGSLSRKGFIYLANPIIGHHGGRSKWELKPSRSLKAGTKAKAMEELPQAYSL